MKRYQVISAAGLPDSLVQQDFDPPPLKSHQVRIAVKACSLNYRDIVVAKGGYPRNDTRPVTALSDLAVRERWVDRCKPHESVEPCR